MFLWTQGEEEGKSFLNKTQKALTMKEEIILSHYIKSEEFLYIIWHHKKTKNTRHRKEDVNGNNHYCQAGYLGHIKILLFPKLIKLKLIVIKYI